jgi:hypothetical protein
LNYGIFGSARGGSSIGAVGAGAPAVCISWSPSKPLHFLALGARRRRKEKEDEK